jgi:hypothetical protein
MKIQLLLVSSGLVAVLSNTAIANVPARANAMSVPEAKLFITCPTRISGGEVGECKVGIDPVSEKERTIKLRSTNTALVQLNVTEVTLAPNQYSVTVPIRTSSTPIKSTVVIKAGAEVDDHRIDAEESINLVPALFGSVKLLANSFIGTIGAKVQCEVKLRAPAPAGGVEIYLSPLTVSPRTNATPVLLDLQNPRVSAGNDVIDFDVAYNDLRAAGVPVNLLSTSGFSIDRSGGSDFNIQTRTLELVVALEPQATTPWQPIKGLAHRVSFDVVPLSVSSLVIQPASVIGGAEALATVTLSASPGNTEKVYLSPTYSQSPKMWPVLLGSSCAPPSANGTSPTRDIGGAIELNLVPGTSSYSFKICTAAVTTTSSPNVNVILRSGFFHKPITINPQ